MLVGDCRNVDQSTFFKKPNGDNIRIRLLVATVQQDLRYFRLGSRLEVEKSEGVLEEKVNLTIFQ